MRVATRGPDLADLDRRVFEVLDRHLAKGEARPVAVALSGGGDSLALTLLAAAWAKAAGRPLLVLSVDHGLQPQSAAWTKACAARAAALGADFRALRWVGPKAARGLPAAARAARHALLADAARAAGARVILMGHTADDILEARAMRVEGATTPEPRVWAPSPAWPEGRDVFLLRPLLGLRRGEIRDWLEARDERWIDDPANDDPRSARTRARQGLPADAAAPELIAPGRPGALAEACRMDEAGVLSVPRGAFRAGSPDQAAGFIGIACLCAAGTSRPPAVAEALRLAWRLSSQADVTATLSGARIEADAGEVRFLREAGETARGGLAPLRITAGQTAVWDGRFEIAADRDLTVRPLAGVAAQLGDADRASLAAIAPKARQALPVAVEGDDVRRLAARPLALARLRAACGLVEREPA
ncbi:MAG: tRNA lysidine(34) synthetase TilS [Phenylobacterium sp.]|nr:MAG: tRNA lysidine(34) synthetase TilS [Phenylobacterium sp.]